VLEQRCRPYLKATTDSWKVDETSIKVKKEWVYLYRAVDSQGNTLDFFLSSTRDAHAAKTFFLKMLAASHSSEPRVINVDKNAAYPKALNELKAEGLIPEHCELRQVKYLNNLIEQDHRFVKRLTRARDGFLLLRDSVANPPRIRGDEYDQKRTSARGGKRRGERAGRTDRSTLWGSSLRNIQMTPHAHVLFFTLFATQPGPEGIHMIPTWS